jgi:hypothetical protein
MLNIRDDQDVWLNGSLSAISTSTRGSTHINFASVVADPESSFLQERRAEGENGACYLVVVMSL